MKLNTLIRLLQAIDSAYPDADVSTKQYADTELEIYSVEGVHVIEEKSSVTAVIL